jgi:4-amino-4-deoxy-L-arabinose transferase-like glycosyltransferase
MFNRLLLLGILLLALFCRLFLIGRIPPGFHSGEAKGALAGIITVLLTYAIVKMRFRSSTALWSAFLLAVAPWHVHNSRYSNDTVLLTFFFILGLYFFFLGLTRRPLYLYFGAAAFALTVYT